MMLKMDTTTHLAPKEKGTSLHSMRFRSNPNPFNLDLDTYFNCGGKVCLFYQEESAKQYALGTMLS